MSGHTLPAVWLRLGKQLQMNAAFACVKTQYFIHNSKFDVWIYNVFQLDSSVMFKQAIQSVCR